MQIFLMAIIVTVLVAFDQVTKIIVLGSELVNKTEPTSFIPGILEFLYTRNPGMAFGMEFGGTIILGCISLIVVILICVFFVKYVNFKKNTLYSIAIALILSGAIGNMIDRFFRSKEGVVDFLQFPFWRSFAVFNVADVLLCIGTALIAIYLLFIYKEPQVNTIVDFEEELVEDQ